jgi:predicted aconitase with swiveling domain
MSPVSESIISIEASAVHPGKADGPVLILDEPLSIWGGLDLQTGIICDAGHPQCGLLVTGQVLVMESGRGSSSSASSLAEAIRLGTAPAAIVLARKDPILAIGALAAAELYGHSMPIVVVKNTDWPALQKASHLTFDGAHLRANINSVA